MAIKALIWDAYQLPDANVHYLPDPAGAASFDFVSELGFVPSRMAIVFFCVKTLTAGNLDVGIQFRPDATWNSLPNNGWTFYVDYPGIGAKFSTTTGQLTTVLSATGYFVTPWLKPTGSFIRVWVDAAATIDGTKYWTITCGLLYKS